MHDCGVHSSWLDKCQCVNVKMMIITKTKNKNKTIKKQMKTKKGKYFFLHKYKGNKKTTVYWGV